MSLSVSLTPASTSRVRYGQAATLLENDLRERKYSAGDKLPTLRELSVAMGMNHRTVRRGIEELVQLGRLEVRRGVGVFVAGRTVPTMKEGMRIVLGCRAFMFDTEKYCQGMSAFLMGAHKHFSQPNISLQTMVHKGYDIVGEIGDAILAKQIDGFVVCAGGASMADADFFARHNIPLVHFGVSPLEHPWACSVVTDHNAVLKQAVDHLRLLGHRRIAFLSWEQVGDGGSIHRLFGRIAFDYELGDVRDLHIRLPDDDDLQWAAIESFFDIDPFPSAVIVHDEFIADVLLAGCRRRGIRVPDDLSIASLHDSMPFGHSVPLTAPDSVKMNINGIYQACVMLEQMIKGEPVPQRQIRIAPELVLKNSTAVWSPR